MRRIIAALSGAALALSLAACSSGTGTDSGSKNGADAKSELDIMTWWQAGTEKEGLAELTKIFEKKYPDIKFENKAVSGGGGSNAKQKLAADLAAKNPPDTYQSHAGAELSADIAAGYLEDVSSVYDDLKLKDAFPADLIKRLTVDGKIYSVPSNIHRSNVVWANAEVLKKANLDPTTPAKDMDEWLEQMKKLQDAGVKYPLAVGTTWTQLHLLENVLLSDLGADAYSGLFDGKTKWDSPEATKAFEHFGKLMEFSDPALMPEDWEPAMMKVVDGSAAFSVMGDWAPPVFKEAKMEWGKDYVTFPVPGTEGVFNFLADSFTLPVGAKHPEATKAWLDVISSKEGQVAFSVTKGSIPARNDLSEEDMNKFDGYAKDCIESFKKDTIVSSIAHGAALPLKPTEAMKNALGKFDSTKDVKALQADFVAAAAM